VINVIYWEGKIGVEEGNVAGVSGKTVNGISPQKRGH
jgi:hypothetical protein